MYTPKHLKRWTLPDSYIGAQWNGYYGSGFGRSRDSDSVEASNFHVAREALEELGAEVVSESHWAVGWVEWIAIHEDNEAALKAADDMCEAAENYPVLNEEHHSALEEEWADEAWEHLPMRDRIHLCSRGRVSIFAARHDFPPSDDSGYIRERLLG